MLKLAGGWGVLLLATQTVNFQALPAILEALGAIGALGGVLAAAVAIYKARSDRDLSNSQAMALLFDRQRDLNVDLLTQRDQEIEQLREQLKHAATDRDQLEQRLKACQRERTVLHNQIRGLEDTIAELRATEPQRRRRRRGHPDGT